MNGIHLMDAVEDYKRLQQAKKNHVQLIEQKSEQKQKMLEEKPKSKSPFPVDIPTFWAPKKKK